MRKDGASLGEVMLPLQDHLGGGKHPASLPPCPPLPSVRKRAGTAQKVQLLVLRVATLMAKLLEVGWGLEVEN